MTQAAASANPAEILAGLARRRARRRRTLAAVLVAAAAPVAWLGWRVGGHSLAGTYLGAHGYTVTWKADLGNWREGGSTAAEVTPLVVGFVGDERSSADTSYLTRLHRVERLDLSRLDGLRDEELACLARLPELAVLNLDQRFSHQWFPRKSTRPTDASLPAIGRLRKLRDLNLAGTRISEAGLAHLAGLAELRVLDLAETPITDAGLSPLAGLKNLGYVNLRGTRVTAEGAARLKRSLPEADVDHESSPSPR